MVIEKLFNIFYYWMSIILECDRQTLIIRFYFYLAKQLQFIQYSFLKITSSQIRGLDITICHP